MSQGSVLLAAPTVRLTDQARQGDLVEAVIVHAMLEGAADMTAFEVEDALRIRFNEVMTPNIVSRVVANLVAAGRVQQDKEDKRPSQGSVIRPQGSRKLSCRLSVPGIVARAPVAPSAPAAVRAAVAAGECY